MLLGALLLATSTFCQTAEVTLPVGTIDLMLIGCGEGFSENTLWHLDRADSVGGSLDGIASLRATGKGALVYVCDTGVMRDHDEFTRSDGSNVIAALRPARHWGENTNCPDGSDRALDPCYDFDSDLFVFTHGTAVASMVAGRNTGVAPDARIVSVMTLHRRAAEVAAWVRAFDDIIAHAWDPATPQVATAIVNMSQSLNPAFSGDTSALEQKIRQMIGGVDRDGRPDAEHGKRFFFTAVAGNAEGASQGQCDANGEVALFPGTRGPSIDGLITVGGLDRENHVWTRSCGGAAVEIFAPAAGVLVASIGRRDLYRSGRIQFGTVGNSGTSYAAPYVAGIAALLLEENPGRTPEQLESLIKARASRTANGEHPVAIYTVPPVGPRRRVVRH